jgi:hypothetical protein
MMQRAAPQRRERPTYGQHLRWAVAEYINATICFDPATRSSWFDEAAQQWRRGTNIERMEAGFAPIDAAGRPIQLHHLTGTEVNGLTGTRGALAEVAEGFHQRNTRTLHIPELHRNPNIPQADHTAISEL